MRPETRKESFLDELILIQKGKRREKKVLEGILFGWRKPFTVFPSTLPSPPLLRY